MSVRTIILVVVAALLIAGLILLAYHSQRVLERGLPERIICASQADAKAQAGSGAYPILGTGSMAPYIPAAVAGLDPLKTVVAYAVASGAGYEAITPGALCIYRATWTNPPGGYVMHQAAQQDSGGWIMSGLHNKQSESWARVTRQNFVALVSRVYVW